MMSFKYLGEKRRYRDRVILKGRYGGTNYLQNRSNFILTQAERDAKTTAFFLENRGKKSFRVSLTICVTILQMVSQFS